MKMLGSLIVFAVLCACSTTPQTVEQWDRYYARQQEREHKAWCLRNGGVWVEDTRENMKRENKCFESGAYGQMMERMQ